jgi:hypothetical protein
MANQEAQNFLISLAQVEHGHEIRDKVEIVINNMKNLDPASYRRKTERLTEADFSVEVRDKLNREFSYDDKPIRSQLDALTNMKVNRDELANYRRVDVEIDFPDLHPEVVRKINESYDGTSIDYTELKGQVQNLANTKADFSALNSYRRKDEMITELDLSQAIVDKLNKEVVIPEPESYDDSELRNQIGSIETVLDNVDSELVYLRNVSDKVSPLVTKVDNLQLQSDSNLSKIQSVEISLESKVDNVALLDYRRKSVLITEGDLEQTILDKLNSTSGGETGDLSELEFRVDTLEGSIVNKVEYGHLANYRLKETKIVEQDLDQAVIDKLNAVTSGGYVHPETHPASMITQETDLNFVSDSDKVFLSTAETRVTTLEDDVTALALDKVDSSVLESYRSKDESIVESDLDQAVRDKLNNVTETTGYDDTQIKGDILDLQTNKADKTELSDYRQNSVKITETDLESNLSTKINSKADASQLSSYRLLSDDIAESDLASTLATKINGKADASQLSNYRLANDDISESELTSALQTKINGKADSSVLSGYRQTSVKISESDLDSATQSKLNDTVTAHTDLTDLNSDSGFLHISAEEKTKYDGYDSLIQQMQLAIETLQQEVADLKANQPSQPDEEPVIANSSLNGSNEVPVGTAQLTFALSGNSNLVISDASLITSSPTDILGTAYIENGELIIPLENMTGPTEYTVTIGAGAIANGSNTNDVDVVTTFTTLDPNTRVVEWTYDFVVPQSTGVYNMTDSPDWNHTMTGADIYGDAFDYNGRVELYTLGVEDGEPDEPGQLVPLDGSGATEGPSMHGMWSYDPDLQQIMFNSGAMNPYYFRLIKYVE